MRYGGLELRSSLFHPFFQRTLDFYILEYIPWLGLLHSGNMFHLNGFIFVLFMCICFPGCFALEGIFAFTRGLLPSSLIVYNNYRCGQSLHNDRTTRYPYEGMCACCGNIMGKGFVLLFFVVTPRIL